MAFSIRMNDGNIAVLGDLDIASAPTLAMVAHAVVSSSRTATIELDLSGTQFIDASGVRCLSEFATVARRSDRNVVVSHAGAPVRRLLALAGQIADLDFAVVA